MQLSSERYTGDSDEVFWPTILVVCSDMYLRGLIQEYLSETKYNIIVAHDRETAHMALAHRPALALIDVVEARINHHEQLWNLQIALERALISRAEYCAAIHERFNAIQAAEQQQIGIEIARDIRRCIADIPVIFTSVERIHLHRLPFGQAFHLPGSSDELLAMIEGALQKRPTSVQPAQGEHAAVLALSRVRGDYILAMAA